MGSLRERNPSLWVATAPAPDLPAQAEPLRRAQVAIIGGGITGLTLARLLVERGADVALLEAGRLAAGTTGYTTAKVTSQHGLIYSELSARFGEDKARIYGQAQQGALEEIRRIVSADAIDCELEDRDSYVYAPSAAELETVQQEATVAVRLGLPATFTDDVGLPFPTAGAVRFTGQAQFHPRRYCLGLADSVRRLGGRIHEGTRVIDVDTGDPCTVKTEHGDLEADVVVLATHLPIGQAGFYYARAYPTRSYAICVRTAAPIPGMYLSAGEPSRSLRTATGGWVVVGGESHKTGQDEHTSARYEALESWAREHVGATEVGHRWSAQDHRSDDGLPFVGRRDRRSGKVLVATAFRKWGMTNGTVAAMILAETIDGGRHDWAPVFDSTRVDPARSLRSFVSENVDVAKRFVGDRFSSRGAPKAAELPVGHGGIVDLDGSKVAAYRGPDGLEVVSPTCTHMGCELRFNDAETTWDCPCHGSRFGTDGRVLEGPATTDLEVLAPGGDAGGHGASA